MFPSAIEEFLTLNVLAFALCFARVGAAIMIMPGLGDSFTPERIRLHMAIGMTLVLYPLIVPYLPPQIPSTIVLFTLICMEFIIGLFFGTIARILMTSLDTAGQVISVSSGLANAQVFNPALSTQGSLIGAFLSVTGVVMLFALNLHHLLIMGIMESYELFPLGSIPDTGSMAQFMAKTVSHAFGIGVKIGMPFIVLTLIVYVGVGVLSRLMPQVQVFLLALPLQILLSVILLLFTVAATFAYWGAQFEDSMVFFLSSGG